MAKHCERPIIFPLSNPAPMAEATPADLIAWTEGRALIATGSPFQPVTYRGVTYVIGQVNNAMLYPGLCLGAIVSRASRISDNMFAAAANAVSSLVAVRLPGASLLPHVDDLRIVSLDGRRGGSGSGRGGRIGARADSTTSCSKWETRCGSRNIARFERSECRFLIWTQRLLFASAAVLLGYCGFVAADTWIFQQLESHSLQRQIGAGRGSMAIAPRGLIGRVEIPRLELSAILVEGDDPKTLRRAVAIRCCASTRSSSPLRRHVAAVSFSTATASLVTSGPMPSPAVTRIFSFIKNPQFPVPVPVSPVPVSLFSVPCSLFSVFFNPARSPARCAVRVIPSGNNPIKSWS